MMEFSTDLMTNLLLIVNAALLAAAAVALVRFRIQARRFEKFWSSPAGVSLADTQSINAQASQAADPRLERRVEELQDVLWKLARKEQGDRQQPETNLPIENAVRMAKRGASIDDLVRNCGLNVGEARLMRKLHGGGQAAQGA